MPSDRRAAIYFRRLADAARTRAALARRKALATFDLVAKTNLEADADVELQQARELDARAAELE
jgi:hypothetical protein